jgi:hypothetical protein
MSEGHATGRDDPSPTESNLARRNPGSREEILLRRARLPAVDADAVRRDLAAVIDMDGDRS